MPPYEVHTPWYSPRYQEGLQLSVIQSTGRDCYYSWFADHSDSPLSKTAVDQYASGKWQNNFPQMKHCTQGIILVTYRCCTSAHSKKDFFFLIEMKLNPFSSSKWGVYIYIYIYTYIVCSYVYVYTHTHTHEQTRIK